jgi:hypothetical protein
MIEIRSGPDLHARLARWVADGLIDAGQASRIEAAEAVVPCHPRWRRSSPAVRAGAARP